MRNGSSFAGLVFLAILAIGGILIYAIQGATAGMEIGVGVVTLALAWVV